MTRAVVKYFSIQFVICVTFGLVFFFFIQELIHPNRSVPHQPLVITTHIAEKANENHKDLKVSFSLPSIENPHLKTAKEVANKNINGVIGIVVQGTPIAFSLKGMSGPGSHVVKLEKNETTFCITYCDIVHCARVFSSPVSKGIVDMTVGGQDVGEQMVLLLNGIRYGQSSHNIPLNEHPFELTDWSEWVQKYPSSMVYSP